MKAVSIILKNISQVLLINNHYTGLLVLIALFIGNWKVGLSALVGSIIAYVLAPHVNYSNEEINDGLAGFSPVLTAIALGTTFKTSINTYFSTFLGLLLTVLLHLGLNTMLEPIGLPSLTMPFILATWIMLFAGRPHRNLENKN